MVEGTLKTPIPKWSFLCVGGVAILYSSRIWSPTQHNTPNHPPQPQLSAYTVHSLSEGWGRGGGGQREGKGATAHKRGRKYQHD